MIARNLAQEAQLFKWKKVLGIRVSRETIRNVLEKHKYSSREARKIPCCQHKMQKKRLRFAIEHISLSPEYWEDVIFSDETKILLYCHDGSQRVWRKPLTGLENKNLISTVKFGKLSVMVTPYNYILLQKDLISNKQKPKQQL